MGNHFGRQYVIGDRIPIVMGKTEVPAPKGLLNLCPGGVGRRQLLCRGGQRPDGER
jgi:hypothetical protein